MNTCKNCNKEFIPMRNTVGIYCSIPCRINDRKVSYNRKCIYCEKEYIAKNKSKNNPQKTCSNACFHKNRLKELIELEKENKYRCKIHGVMSIDNFREKSKKYVIKKSFYCCLCESIYRKKRRDENPDKYKENKKKYYVKYKYKHAERGKKWKKENPDKVKMLAKVYRNKNRELIREKHKEQVNSLKRYYVKSCMLTKLKIGEVPEELIEAKRQLMILKRKLKEVKNVTKEC